jgi:hypothetical protein
MGQGPCRQDRGDKISGRGLTESLISVIYPTGARRIYAARVFPALCSIDPVVSCDAPYFRYFVI